MVSRKPGNFPRGNTDERELFLDWLGYLRESVIRNLDGLTPVQALLRPGNHLLPILGVINHLTHVERRWIDGGFRGQAVPRNEEEFFPTSALTAELATERYRARGRETDAFVRGAPSLELPFLHHHLEATDQDLRWVLLHLINETARHAGHADATREMIDGATGE